MMSHDPLVSVIIPAYNAEKYLAEAVNSILGQTYKNLELLVADDASVDGTKKIIQSMRDQRIRPFYNVVNRGYLNTTNRLFQECRGELITFMDADDWSDERRIELLVTEFKKDRDLGCAGSFAVKVSESGKKISDIKFKCRYEEIKDDLPAVFNFLGAGIMIRREVLDTVGGYDRQFNRIGAEHLYWGGKIIMKYKTINLPLPLYYYRHLDNSFSNNNKRSIKGQLSTELAQIGLNQLKCGIDIFAEQNADYYWAAMRFLMMKYNFWNNNFITGFYYFVLSSLSTRIEFADRKKLFSMYFRKWVKQMFVREHTIAEGKVVS